VHSVSDVVQTEIHALEQLVPHPSPFQAENHTANVKMYTKPTSDQVLAEFIQERAEILLSHFHKLINSIWDNEELPEQLMESNTAPIYVKGH
jgi:hypothetical protein